ncbi:MAG: alpha-amylase family glycosyl hydrolase, partial [Bacteroidota bacterium]
VKFIATATAGGDMITNSFQYVGVKENRIEELPAGIQPGLNRVDGSSSILALYAPLKEYVFVLGNFNQFVPDTTYQMNQTPDGEMWWLSINNLNANDTYLYQYLVDGNIKIADPYSTLILDPWNDPWIPDSLESVPLDYPNDLTDGHLSVFNTTPDVFEWAVNDFEKPAIKDLVIYEILMRDFLNDHSYKSLIDTLDYLQELGINAIELMPVSEFENNDSWGYNPSYHMALDKYYGSPKDFKRFVDEAHQRGIAVILDIVYNHAFGQSPLVRLWWDNVLNKPSTSSPYFNPDAKHPFNVGFDFNHDSEATQQFVNQTIAYWIDEYRIDGFRFDLSKGFTQKQSNNNDVFSSYDPARIARLKSYADHIWDIDKSSLLILEHFASNNEEKELANYGFMLWGNSNFNFNEATMGYNENGKSDFGHIYAPNRTWTENNLVGYMESHDEERLMYKNTQFGNSSAGYNVKELETGLDRVEMASAFFFTIPGPKMIWQFGEMGFDFSINRCTNGSISEDCRLSRKPIRWDYLNESGRADLLNTFSKMIQLKTTHPAIHEGAVSLDVRNTIKRINLSHADGNITVIGNFGVNSANVGPRFQRTGKWYNYLTKDSLMVDNVNAPITLSPGEFAVFIDDDSFLTNVINLDVENDFLKVFPNPVQNVINIESKNSSLRNMQIELLDITGKQIFVSHGNLPMQISKPNVSDGIYLLRLTDQEGKIYLKKLIL